MAAFPPAAIVGCSRGAPFHGIIASEPTPGEQDQGAHVEILWECRHEHSDAAQACACAGAMIDRLAARSA